MDEEQVKKLLDAALAPALRSAFQEMRGYFAEQLTPIQEKLSEFEVATGEKEPQGKQPTSEASPELTALTARLAQMEKQEAERQAELRSYKFGNELQGTISKYDPIHGDLVKELLATRYANKTVEKDGKYYTPAGTTLEEEIDTFFKSETGSHFLKPPAATSTGTQKSNATLPTKGTASLEDMLMDMEF